MRPTLRPFAAALGVLLVLSTVACSSDDEPAPEPERTEAADLDRFATTDVAELLRAEPGRLDLETDRDEIVAQVRAAYDDGVRGEELYRTLLDLGAADFREYQEFLDTFEMEFSDPGQRPDGSVVGGDGQVEPFLNVQVLFDASGSMRGRVDGRPKIDLAKEAVEEFVQRLPEGVNISLRAYGHLGSNQEEDKAESCGTTEDVYPFGAYDEARFSAALASFSPTGFTPIGRAIEDAAADLAALPGDLPSAVYVVSDGEETCDGDPVAAARDLVADDVQAVVNIIGFDVADAEARALARREPGGHRQRARHDPRRRRRAPGGGS
ncbi:VWA domain-containing protein [Aeromicrobium halocynthiae]|uniref:VWA domain-containing protein n=1 Tax=Aeromicrobium halocynthiae TaxID=560557 RepID=UPI0031D45704